MKQRVYKMLLPVIVTVEAKDQEEGLYMIEHGYVYDVEEQYDQAMDIELLEILDED